MSVCGALFSRSRGRRDAPMTVHEIETTSADDTRALGERIGRALAAGDVVLLNGDLGAGKTTLAQGIAVGMGISEPVQSPTFTLVGEHQIPGTGLRLYHLDLYRLIDPSELESFGYEQFIDPVDGISLVEWPERAGAVLPDRYLLIDIDRTGPDCRRVVISSNDAGLLNRVVSGWNTSI